MLNNVSSPYRVAICTGGGDAPGLNAVIRAAVLSALNRGWECYGIRDGFAGLLAPKNYPHGGVVPLTRDSVRGITSLGGTIIGTTNRGNPLRYPTVGPDGKKFERDRTDELVNGLAVHGIDALISIGGDGSMEIAAALAKKGVKVIGVPKTIDNDLEGTDATFGFDTAVAFATDCFDRLQTTAQAHQRVMVVEVMGRYAGWIALHSGIAGSANVILIPEIPFDIHKVAEKIHQREQNGRPFTIVAVAEGACPIGGGLSVLEKEMGKAERLGGVGEKVAADLQAMTGRETRLVVLGHLLRGGTPTAADRLLALRFGAAAIRALAEGQSGVMVALNPPTVNYIPLEEATKRLKTVPPDCDTMLSAREMAICFGD
ncbi:MAG TPA: ATP-dependent 6-phosphofructokinase [Thermoflexales bacterium]|nr:ATP-dependent 6-phosphofructokinase [Thermoflexales bacterium]HQX10371.1 ATP-dependent 6-phosphofructokinase [Thermoflexales bacterium]HQY25296.1 ATP-dependent 6-phosphofructokinase [Thermoflexales bacterium]HQZ55455.1 ATP-dependent 6-phosphofructokinase [Thermoflexales bacterium]HRA54727.1 ATP-dependent 6-phosphofructokinase [Thermoflexales bacterium]